MSLISLRIKILPSILKSFCLFDFSTSRKPLFRSPFPRLRTQDGLSRKWASVVSNRAQER